MFINFRSLNYSHLHFKGFDSISDLNSFIGTGDIACSYHYEFLKPYHILKIRKIHLLNQELDGFRIWLEFETLRNDKYCERYLEGKDNYYDYLSWLKEKYNLAPKNGRGPDLDIYKIVSLAEREAPNVLYDWYSVNAALEKLKQNGVSGIKTLKLYKKFLKIFKRHYRINVIEKLEA